MSVDDKLQGLVKKSDNPDKMQEIVNELIEAGFNDNFMTGREIKALPKLLDDREHIKFATSGFLNDGNSAGSVLVVVTNKRLLLENKKLIFGSDNTDIPLDQINSISYNTKMVFGEVTFSFGMSKLKIEQIQKANAEPLSKALKSAINDFKNGKTNQIHQDMDNQDTSISANKLREMKQLVDDGIISNEEFEAAKKKYLGL